MSRQRLYDLIEKRTKFEENKNNILGRKTEFEITLKAIKALLDFANGIKQAANITNQQLNQNAKDGLQYLQDISQLMQDIRQAKQQLDADLDVIESAQYPEGTDP